jgi:hypothetical protein
MAADNKSTQDEEALSEKNAASPSGEEAQTDDSMQIEDSELPSDMPKPVRRVITQFMGEMRRSGPASSPLVEKLTSEHIDQLIEITNEDSRLEYRDAQQRRKYSVAYFLIGSALFVFLVIYLSGSNPDLLEALIGYLIAFLGGLGGGYGIKSWRDRRN